MSPATDRYAGVIERYRSLLPIADATPIVTLGEGSTPLIESPKLGALLGNRCQVYLKYEGLNPTGSFKDRGMTVAVSKAVESGATTLVCASTGNTSASAAAYAARAGLRCAVLVPAGNIALGKLAQAFVYGAKVIAIDGNFDSCLRIVRELENEPGIGVVNSINPNRLEGQKTAAFEIADALEEAPFAHVLPVGNFHSCNTAPNRQGRERSHKYQQGEPHKLVCVCLHDEFLRFSFAAKLGRKSFLWRVGNWEWSKANEVRAIRDP